MGERANYAIVNDRGLELYYARFGAVELLRDLAVTPQDAVAFVRNQQPATHWLDDILCEGAVVIDTVRQVLLLFTWHHDGVADRARRLAEIRAAWPDWQVRWAYGGIEDVVAHLHRDPHTVRTEREPIESLEGPFAEYPQEATCVLTIREPVGTLRGYSVHHEFCEPLWAGPRLLDLTAPLTPTRGRGVLSGDDTGPDLGVHLDVARQEVGFWTVATFKGSVEELAACWPDWRFEFWEDRHAEQTTRCGDDFRMFPF